MEREREMETEGERVASLLQNRNPVNNKLVKLAYAGVDIKGHR